MAQGLLDELGVDLGPGRPAGKAVAKRVRGERALQVYVAARLVQGPPHAFGAEQLVESGSVCGLVAADAERSRRLYDPCYWSWEQLRQLVISPTEAGFYVVHVPIRDTGNIRAANGSFDIAVLSIAPTTGVQDSVVQSLVRCVRRGGLSLVVQSHLGQCQLDTSPPSDKACADVDRCIEVFHANRRENITVLYPPEVPHPICRSAHPARLVALVEST